MTTQTQPIPRRIGPQLSVKAWCYLLSGVVAINALYVLSWPFVIHVTSTITHQPETVFYPRTGETRTVMVATVRYHPLAELVYSPLLFAEDANMPLVSALLTWYDNTASQIAWKWFGSPRKNPTSSTSGHGITLPVPVGR